MSFQALRLLDALRKRAQGLEETRNDGSVWREVFPMDIQVSGISAAQKSGYLSALEKAGFYKKTDRYFGLVRIR